MTFSLRSTAYAYRPLRKPMSGWDVWALQKCLIGAGYPLPQFGADGFFGTETHNAVTRFQQAAGLVKDGVAGVITQRALAVGFVARDSENRRLPQGLLLGQVEAESSFWLGNYTAPYENLRRDMGLVMLNLDVTEENCRKAFDGPARIGQLAAFLRSRHDGYYGDPGARTQTRAWQLAAAAWNAPSVADRVASGDRVAPDWMEEYIERVTAYATNLEVS